MVIRLNTFADCMMHLHSFARIAHVNICMSSLSNQATPLISLLCLSITLQLSVCVVGINCSSLV